MHCSRNHLGLSKNCQQDHRVTLTLGTGAQVKKSYMSSFLSAQSLLTSHQNRETHKSGMSQLLLWFKAALVNVLSNIVIKIILFDFLNCLTQWTDVFAKPKTKLNHKRGPFSCDLFACLIHLQEKLQGVCY